MIILGAKKLVSTRKEIENIQVGAFHFHELFVPELSSA